MPRYKLGIIPKVCTLRRRRSGLSIRVLARVGEGESLAESVRTP